MVSLLWGTIKLQRARSSVTVDSHEWGFGQVLPVFLLIGPLVMATQAVIHPIMQENLEEEGSKNTEQVDHDQLVIQGSVDSHGKHSASHD